jgi:hypothetical protein
MFGSIDPAWLSGIGSGLVSWFGKRRLTRLRFREGAMSSSSRSSLMENANTGQANRCTLFDAICVAVLSARYARVFVKTKGRI